MKKYLMTGIAALAMCAGLTSCSHDLSEPTQEEINAVYAKKVTDTYNSAFIAKFGTPAANQDWGFGSGANARTRSHDVNGNLWYQNWVRPINVGAEVSDEAKKVLEEFSKKRENMVNTINIDWNNYWVQQVHQSTNTYKDLDGGNTGDIHASMNKIIAYNEQEVQRNENGKTFTTHYEHVNNFNNGTNTTTYTDDVTKEKFIGTTLMKDMGVTPKGTPKFGYHNTKDSKDHFEYIIIPGSQIFPNNPEMHKYYYVGFDFQANYDNIGTKFRFRPTGANADLTFEVDGVYKLPADNGKKVKTNAWVDGVKKEVEYTIGEGGTWSIDGYRNGNMWIDRDWVFNDWIVRISPAEAKQEDPNFVRIIAEDLTPGSSDWDFNDVVFDVVFNEAGNGATVTLLKAGGTLALKVAGHEVHAAFGYPDPDAKGLYKMINTGAKADVNGATAEPFTVSCQKSNRGNDIKVEVNKGTAENPNWIELTAQMGQPAAKLAVDKTFKICDETVNIETAYPNFPKFVKDPSIIWW